MTKVISELADCVDVELLQEQLDLLVPKLRTYLDLLYAWNGTYRLTSVLPQKAWLYHILDSATVALSWQAQLPKSLLDVGSGGGQPGIILALLFPQLRVTLLDCNRKKAAFLTQVKIELGLDNVSVLCEKVQNLSPVHHHFDCICARAVASLSQLFIWTKHLMEAQSGYWIAMKTEAALAELSQLKKMYPMLSVGVQEIELSPDGGKRLLIRFGLAEEVGE